MSKNDPHPRRTHALQNEKACNYLNASGDFPDWVITTAFYSALQFIKHKVFPITIDGQTFNDFTDYYEYDRNHLHPGRSQHNSIQSLTKTHMSNIANQYKRLYSMCHNARYVDYRVDQQDADYAMSLLAEVKKFCNTNKPA